MTKTTVRLCAGALTMLIRIDTDKHNDVAQPGVVPRWTRP